MNNIRPKVKPTRKDETQKDELIVSRVPEYFIPLRVGCYTSGPARMFMTYYVCKNFSVTFPAHFRPVVVAIKRQPALVPSPPLPPAPRRQLNPFFFSPFVRLPRNTTHSIVAVHVISTLYPRDPRLRPIRISGIVAVSPTAKRTVDVGCSISFQFPSKNTPRISRVPAEANIIPKSLTVGAVRPQRNAPYGF